MAPNARFTLLRRHLRAPFGKYLFSTRHSTHCVPFLTENLRLTSFIQELHMPDHSRRMKSLRVDNQETESPDRFISTGGEGNARRKRSFEDRFSS